MLRLSDFVTCRKRYYNQSRGIDISALEHCRMMKFRTYLPSDTSKHNFYVVTVE